MGIPIFLLAVWYGGWIHFALTALVMVFALYELNKIYIGIGLRPPLILMVAGVLVISVSAFTGGTEAIGAAITLVVVVFLLSSLIRFPALMPGDMAVGITGILYVGLFIYFYLIRTLNDGFTLTIIMLACTWAADTGAYIVGKKIGKRKLNPKLSPGKTWEGALGGYVASTLTAVLINMLHPVGPLAIIAVMGMLVGLVGLLGDLYESSLKRIAGVKDTGLVIPGHGGVLDRFDSMLFTAPLVYYFSIIFING